MSNPFINAETAREQSRDSLIIHTETCSIETEILTQVDAGSLSAVISSGTEVTDNTEYYQAYNNITDDDLRRDRIAVISKYFTDLGYSVTLTTNPLTNNTLQWNISW